jgi:hypothetical protein
VNTKHRVSPSARTSRAGLVMAGPHVATSGAAWEIS